MDVSLLGQCLLFVGSHTKLRQLIGFGLIHLCIVERAHRSLVRRLLTFLFVLSGTGMHYRFAWFVIWSKLLSGHQLQQLHYEPSCSTPMGTSSRPDTICANWYVPDQVHLSIHRDVFAYLFSSICVWLVVGMLLARSSHSNVVGVLSWWLCPRRLLTLASVPFPLVNQFSWVIALEHFGRDCMLIRCHDCLQMQSSDQRAIFEECGRLMVAIRGSPVPVICQVNGLFPSPFEHVGMSSVMRPCCVDQCRLSHSRWMSVGSLVWHCTGHQEEYFLDARRQCRSVLQQPWSGRLTICQSEDGRLYGSDWTAHHRSASTVFRPDHSSCRGQW